MLVKSPSAIVLFAFTWMFTLMCHPVSANDLVEVSGSVDFRANVAPYRWNAIFIDLKANRNTSPDAIDSQYVDNVKVILTLGYELGEQQFAFYQSEVTLVSLEQSDRKRITFFMPKEIVDRDELDNEPEYWTIDLEVNGEMLPMRRDRSSTSISDAESLNYFKNAYASAIAETRGILVPAHRSPYGYGYGERREPPAVIWKQAE